MNLSAVPFAADTSPDASSAVSVIDPLVPTIFHEPWWLDIATQGRYGITEVSDSGRAIGRMPYFLRGKGVLRRGVMPPLTHFLGPAFAAMEGSTDTQFTKRLEIASELIAKLPPAARYTFKCHKGITDVIAFQKARFNTSVQFTHEIAPATVASVWDAMTPKRRKAISKAESQLTVEEITDPAILYRFNHENLRKNRLQSYYDIDIFKGLVEASMTRGQGRIIASKDASGKLIATVFCVWDHKSYYFLMGTRQRDSYRGSLSLLVWEAVKDAMNRQRTFDMDGLSNNDSVAFFTGFGATITPRYIAKRENHFMRLAGVFQSLLHEPNYYC